MAQLPAHPLLSNDVLLRSALRRVAQWFRSAEWKPELDLLSFEADPARLATLGRRLAQGSWVPPPFPLLPYPKDATRLRHYCAPPIEAQVAFMAFGVLLAPLIETALRPFAFGNRWHRPLRRDRTRLSPQWVDGPFVFDAPSTYAPYARDYGLFRRTAHWCACAATGSDPTATERPDSATKRQDFSHRIPAYCDETWWPVRDGRIAYWVKLDLRLAYPSVVLETLRRTLHAYLSQLDHRRLSYALARYPGVIRDHLEEDIERRRIVDSLIAYMSEIRYTSTVINTRHWLPEDSPNDWLLPDDRGARQVGLPTGLAVSGLLFNGYMLPVDDAMEMGMADSQGDKNRAFAFLRFADDMLVIGTTPHAVLAAIDRLRTVIGGDAGRPPLNLQLNSSKMRPKTLARCLDPLLRRREPLARSGSTLEECAWREAQLRRDRVGPFVTHLVETMSRLGTERLTGRFGAAAAEQLQDLHELIHLRIEDDEVREDTRLAFAAPRLASGFLGQEGSASDAAEIARIRQSIGEAVERAPAKFSLWRAVVRAGVRRPFAGRDGTTEASDWLASMLERIACGKGRSWLQGATADEADCCKPTTAKRKRHPTDGVVLDLHASFLRAVFWRELRTAIEDLRRIPGVAERAPRAWSTQSWTFRALDETAAKSVLAWASDLERWGAVLYAHELPPVAYWWEYESLTLAALATAPMTAAFAREPGSAPLARAVTTTPPAPQGFIDRMLASDARVATSAQIKDLAPFARLLLASLSAPTRSRASTTAAVREVSRIAPAAALRFAQRLGVTAEHLRTQSRKARQSALALDRTIWDLESAALMRQQALETVEYATSGPFYIEEVMWAERFESGWVSVQPRRVPARGLPTRIALTMLVDALEQCLSTDDGYWWNIGLDNLVHARVETLRPGARLSFRDALPTPAVSLLSKDNRRIPRHPAYMLAERWGANRGSVAHRALCQVWQFFVAAEGSERTLTHAVLAPDRSLPLEEQWRLRSRVPLPTLIWAALDKLLQYIRELPALESEIRDAAGILVRSGRALLQGVTLADFDWDRTDVRLELDGGPVDVPMGRVPLGGWTTFPIDADLPGEVSVRVAQVTAKPDWNAYYDAFKANNGPPPTDRAQRQAIMRQVHEAFAPTTRSGEGPIVMPEVSIPHEELPSLRALVSAHRRAALAGLYWREPSTSSGGHGRKGNRYLVNEAVLIAPVCSPRDPALPVVREFRIRKPIPAHIEDGLCAAVSTSSNRWQMLDGRDWFRFVHPAWGDFTVAICSDLVDPTPWASMSGEVLHLFLVSYNEDVDLFEQMTWVRAFELHCNVVATNHGAHGGSFVWTPRSAHAKEVARLRGESLVLFADVVLPVAELADHQRRGVARAVKRAKDGWGKPSSPKRNFKSPRPRYPGRR
jgi:hypothetical protein